MPFGFFDPTMALLIPAMIFAFWAQWKVQHTYQKWSRVRAANGLNGADMARAIMNRNGVTDVGIEEVGGMLSDHYDPRVKKVRLSSHNFRESTIAGIAVGAHEVGHVLQHHQGYMPLQIRSLMAPVVGIGSTLAFPLFFIGLIFQSGASTLLMDLGIILFTGAVLFHLVTLPVEFDASKRALAELTTSGALAPQEVAGAKQVLDAAALTYVAAAAMAALQLVRLVMIRNSRD
jgi:Zn-dependent membrane protease YugP